MAKKSIWNQISNPRDEYIDGYGVSRPVNEPRYVTVGRKIYNGIDNFLNGPEEFNGAPINKGAGALEFFFDPAGKIDDAAKLAKNLQQIAKKYKRRTSFDLPEETLMLLKESGLSNMDASRLLERGWDPDQIFEALGRHDIKPFGKPNSNLRVKDFNKMMLDVGMKPNSVSKFEYLTEILKSGKNIYKDKYGNPYTYEEWVRKFPDQDPSKSIMSQSELIDYYN